MENQRRTAPEDAWTFTLMHHPPYSPRGCVFKFLGSCIGGHEDEHGLKPQLRSAWGAGDDERSNGPHHPDFMITAHNHFYARTRGLDGLGYPAGLAAGGGDRAILPCCGAPALSAPLHCRCATGGSFHHFVYMRIQPEIAFFWAIDDHGQVRDSGCMRKGETADRCIAQGTYRSATLACGEPAVPDLTCPAPRP